MKVGNILFSEKENERCDTFNFQMSVSEFFLPALFMHI